jgi:hypothetical protein
MSADSDMVENAARAIRNRAEQPIDMAEARYLARAALDASGIGELVVQAETYRQMHEDAVELGYSSILEALEDLERRNRRRSPLPRSRYCGD